MRKVSVGREEAATAHRELSDEVRARESVIRFRRRMLEWANPVEFVNNMYGCHPGEEDQEYFDVVFAE